MIPAGNAGNPVSGSIAGQRVLVTGVAGFIGMHVARALLEAGASVTGIDNFDPYYDLALKKARVETLRGIDGFAFERIDLADGAPALALFARGFDGVVHLAAQPGVRHSLIDPGAYVRNNIVAFGHVLEGCRHHPVRHLVYASSSSVYGANHVLPFSEDQPVDHPVSLYAATKKANELMAHSYSHLYRLPTTGLRFFTVYGPWGRPDQAPMLFAKAIVDGCRSMSSTKAECSATSRTSTTSSKASSAFSRVRRPRMPMGHLTRSTTSATTRPSS